MPAVKSREEFENDFDDPEAVDASPRAGIVPSPDSLSLYLAEINRFRLLTPEEEQELARRYRKEGDVEAAERLVTANLRFVVKIAMEYRRFLPAVRFPSAGRGELDRLLDLIQEGNIGLMTAVKRFDPDRGYRLISYAVWWIRAFIQRYLLYNWSMVKLGTTQSQRKIFFKLAQAKRKMMSLPLPEESGTEPEIVQMTAEEADQISDPGQVDYTALAKMLDVGEKELIETDLRMAARDFSLDAKLGDGDDNTFMDVLPDQARNQEEILGDQEEKTMVQEGLEKVWPELDEREAFVVQNRYLSDSPLTLQEIGEKYGVSRERVRQIEERALNKIKPHLVR